ncbi:phosphotransferase family protein [Fusibacter sp. JL216-2]|uniref:phosphotransferase family protein n=1 Tax=Fusibacter sp. JL216-2 TaxID=3071453 RepID=UPI003D32B0B0
MSKLSKWKKRIEAICPTIQVEAIAVNDSGQNNTVVTVNHEWVFRFPKYQEELINATKEYHVLKVLQKYISLPIPVPQYAHLDTSNYKEAYLGYRLIPGRPLFRQSFLAHEDHEKLAKQLGTFLKELHSVPTVELQSLDLKTLDSRKNWMTFYGEVREHLYPMMREDATIKLSLLFETFLSDPRNFTFEPRLIHGDFGPTNILYKEEDISGILDFGETCIDDPAIDIAALIGKFGYGQEFIKLMEPSYPKVLDYLNRAKFYASTFALQDALFGYKHKNKEMLQFGLEDYI